MFAVAREEANDLVRPVPLSILGSDRDPHCIELCKRHAKKAGVTVNWAVRPVEELTDSREGGLIVCNPPYGERLLNQKSAEKLYAVMRERFDGLSRWKKSIISGYKNFETAYGKKADARRNLSNGGMPCTLYQYFRF